MKPFRKLLNGTENILKLGSNDKRDIKVKEGLLKFPFEMLSFFFVLFFCISYLFGFAFAFHDLYTKSTTNDQTQALFKERKYAPPPPILTPPPQSSQNLETHFFYFNAGNSATGY